MNTDRLIEIFQKKIPRTVTKIYDGGNRLLVATKLNNGKKGLNVDPYYTMKKDGTDIRGFTKLDGQEFFKKAVQNPIFQLETDEEMLERRKKENERLANELRKAFEQEED